VITAYDAYQIRLSSGRAGRPTAARSGCRSTRRLRALQDLRHRGPDAAHRLGHPRGRRPNSAGMWARPPAAERRPDARANSGLPRTCAGVH